MNNKQLIKLGVALVFAGAAAMCGIKANAATKVKCATGIEKVTVLGTVGMDGSKPYAIVAHYDGIIQGAKLTPQMFEVTNYGTSLGERDGNTVYYPTGKRGSGTLGYNSACSAFGSRERLNPGWRTQEQILSQGVDKQTWVDPVRDVATGCEYLLYPTTQRGEGTEGSCMVYLPKGYHESNLRYLVIYYLHGGTGNQREGRWMIARIDSAIASGSMKPAIVVCPHAMPIGWYLNGNMSDPKVTTGPIEDVLIKDLIPYIDSHYRTIASRNARGIEGFSMGGCGALRLAMKYPELFSAVSSVAGAVVAWDEEPLTRALECTFGDINNPASRKYFEANQPEVFAKKNAKKIGKLGLDMRIFVGTNDRLYDENGNHIIPRFSQYLNKLKIKHSFTIIPDAGHNPSEMFDAKHLPYDVTFWNTLSSPE
ncbi:MAG: alpha/beta hydrolase [Muribaculaceae bacterium]